LTILDGHHLRICDNPLLVIIDRDFVITYLMTNIFEVMWLILIFQINCPTVTGMYTWNEESHITFDFLDIEEVEVSNPARFT
jgi:hypothetical protein